MRIRSLTDPHRLPTPDGVRRRTARRDRRRGQSVVEFALILPVFLLLFGSALDLGRLYAAQVTVTNAAREGAFQAATTPSSYSAGQPCPSDGLSNLVVCRTILEAKNSFVTVAPADIAMTCSVSGCPTGMGNTTTVAVTGHFQLLTPILSAFFGGNQNITFVASSTQQIQTLPTPAATATPTPTPTPTATPTPTPTATPTPAPCTAPSAGFTYSTSPPSMQATVTLSVTDTSTTPSGCPITNWTWSWGDGTQYIGQTPGTHAYGTSGTYSITLTVTNGGGSSTSGVVTIKVK